MSLPRLVVTMAAHLPRLPFLLFVSLVAHVPASHGDPAPPLLSDSSMCSEEPLMCGNVYIKYPFYLSNNTSYSCGYTDLEITCHGEGPNATPEILIGGHNYAVLNISYDDSHTIILADADMLSGGSCPEVPHNVTFDEAWEWPHNTSSNDNLTFYFGCDPMPPDLKKYKIDCNGMVGHGDRASFVFTPHDGHDDTQEHELDQDGHCSEIVSVPVRSEALMASNQSMLVSGGYVDVLMKGFELEWYQETTGPCYLCEESGGKCAYNESKELLGCLCSNGKVVQQHPFCKPKHAMVWLLQAVCWSDSRESTDRRMG